MTRPARGRRPESGTDALIAPNPATARAEITASLADLDIAPENLRHGEAADDQIPQLAAAIRAAGLLQHPTARPGRKGEAPWMLLDGRRRLLALRLLREAGDVPADHPVRLFVETDRARQAAAVVLTNTAAPVHVADVIAAIGRMLKARLGVAEIAAALGHAEIEIRRLAALSALPAQALEALKAGRLTLKQARLLARLTSPEEQEAVAAAALEGHGFPEWRLQERLDQDRVTAHDPRCRLVDPERYVGAGGRLEPDLFGEHPPVILDPQVLTAVWLERVRPLAETFEAQGFTVKVSAGDRPEAPEDQEVVGWCYGAGLTTGQADAWKAARDAHASAVEAAAAAEIGEDVRTDLGPLVAARVARDQAAVGGRAVTVIVLTPSGRTGVDVECWSPREPEAEDAGGPETTAFAAAPAPPPVRAPVLALPRPEVEGVGHSLHALRTDIATRGLIRALADNPDVALTALLVRLFTALVLRVNRSSADACLAIAPEAYSPAGGRVIETLDGEIRGRLEARRTDWDGSGLTAVAWIHGLEAGDRLSLLADLVAVTVDLREARTTSIREPARAMAAELAALCAFDLTDHWTPDAPFLMAHAIADLTQMLADMGAAAPATGKLRKSEFAARVEAEAETRRWAPGVLDWAAPLASAAVGRGEEPDPPSGDPGDDDGVEGVFVVTPEGEAELGQPAS